MKHIWKFLFITFISVGFQTNGQDAGFTTLELLFEKGQKGSTNIDSVLLISDQIEYRSRDLDYDWGIAQANYLKGVYHYRKSQPDTAASYFLKVIDLSEQQNKPTYEEGRARNFLGLIFQRLNSFEKAQEQFEKSVEIFDLLGYDLYKLMSLNNVGTNHGMKGDYPQALRAFLEVKKIAESGGLEKDDANQRLSKAYGTISIVYSITGRNRQALAIADSALQLNKAMKDTVGMAYSYINLGEIHEDENRLDSALFYYQLALNVAPATSLQYARQYIAAMQKIASVYFKQGSAAKATKQIESLLPFQLANETYGIEDSYTLLAKYYEQTGNLLAAVKYSRLAFQTGRKSGAKRTVRGDSRKLAALFAKLQRFDSAYFYQSQYSIYSDSVFNESNERKFNNLRIEFETADQQREIQQLKAEKELAASRRNMRYFAFAFITTFLISNIIILIYRAKNIRKKQTISQLKLQQQLQQKETELQQQTLHMINLSNNMTEVEEKLKAVRKKENPSKQDVQKVLSNISIKKSMGEEWNKFESYFANNHPKFSSELMDKHGNLSRQERRLIALIKMDLSNREIANLFNIEPRSVSMNKYRRKQKLGLTENDDLDGYIQHF